MTLSFSSSLLRPPWFWSFWSEEFESCTSCWGELVLSGGAGGAGGAGAAAAAVTIAGGGRGGCEPEGRGKLWTDCGGDVGWTII